MNRVSVSTFEYFRERSGRIRSRNEVIHDFIPCNNLTIQKYIVYAFGNNRNSVNENEPWFCKYVVNHLRNVSDGFVSGTELVMIRCYRQYVTISYSVESYYFISDTWTYILPVIDNNRNRF